MPLHTPACHVATPSALPIQFTTPTPMYRQNPFRRRLHTSSCRCPPSLCSVPAHTCLHRLSSVVRCMSRLSHPVTLSLRVRAYKRSPPPVAIRLRQRLLSASGKPRRAHLFPPPPLSVGRSPRCLPLSSCRSWSFAKLWSYFSTRRTDTFIVSELLRLDRDGESSPHRCSPFLA
jgi:hypothetical protein